MIELRPYQMDCIKALNQAVEKGQTSSIMALPTGSGKTITAVSWLKQFLEIGKKVLWFVHRIELLDQARAAFAHVVPGIKVTEWTANDKDASGQVVLAMILSAQNLNQPFDVVVIDEAHHAAMPSYEAKLEDIPRGFTLGLTATPTRLDGRQLPFDGIAAQQTVIELARQGWLAQPKCFRVETRQKFRMKIQAGDFAAASLKQLDNDTRNEVIVKTWKQQTWGKTLAFCSSIEHAEHLATAFAEQNVEADVLHSQLGFETRSKVVAKFRQPEPKNQLLLNIGIFTEGLDVPDIDSIFLCRPTASEVLFLQMVGRGTRICDAKKTFNVVDFVDDMGKYSLLHRSWEQQHLGWEDADLKAREAEAAKKAELKAKLKDLLLLQNEIEVILKAVDNYVGVAVYKSQYDAKPHRLILTRETWDCIQKFRMMAAVMPASEAVPSSYIIAGAADINFDFAEWRNLVWSVWFQDRGRKDKATFDARLFVDDVQTQEQVMNRIEDLNEAKKDAEELNKKFGAFPGLQVLKDMIERKVDPLVRPKTLLSSLSFHDQILTVGTDIRREDLRGSRRAEIRERIESASAELVGAPVALILRWAK